MACIYNAEGREITAGLQEEEVIRVAQEIANDRGEPVWVEDAGVDDWCDLIRVDPHPEQPERTDR